MNFLMTLSHITSGAHVHPQQIVPIAVISVLAVSALVFFGRKSLARK